MSITGTIPNLIEKFILDYFSVDWEDLLKTDELNADNSTRMYLDKINMLKKTTKNNDENDQISTIFGIFRQILEKPSLAKYIEVYISRKTILSAFYYFFSYYLLFCILLKLLHFSL